MNQLGEHTFWNDLQDWFSMTFVGAPYDTLADEADKEAAGASLIVRNASWFGPMKASAMVPTIGLIQDIMEGPGRVTQEIVARTCRRVVFNSAFTASMYPDVKNGATIPLPVDFDTFEPGNHMGLQQALGLPDRCVVWVGAHEGAAGHIKGWDIMLAVARTNPHMKFVAVFKDSVPDYAPFNIRMYARLDHETLARVIGACRVGLCTSRTETQHLAGIEMVACGLPLVVPNVGTYWKRENMPGVILGDMTPQNIVDALNMTMAGLPGRGTVRDYWRGEFDGAVVRSEWAALIKEVEA